MLPFWRRRVGSFAEERQRLRLCESRDLGVVEIPVERITGSVGRWQDFDRQFRLVNPATTQRLQGIRKALEAGAFLPPIHVYKVGDHYFVADGNHRVSAAKEMGMAYLDAHVQEFFPAGDDDPAAAVFWRERSDFEALTGMGEVEFTQAGSYRLLLNRMRDFQKEEQVRLNWEISLPEAARAWQEGVADPLRRLAVTDQLHKELPDRTYDDIILYLVEEQIGNLRAVQPGLTYREAVAQVEKAPGQSLGDRLRLLFQDLADAARHLLDGGN